MKLQKEQVEIFEEESWNYLQRNYKEKNIREVPVHEHFIRIFDVYPIDIKGGSILDIGCGPGNVLYHLWQRFEAKRGVGTEPSAKAVQVLNQTYPELEFVANDSRVLPFGNGEFDLVIIKGVLMWIDRNYILQTIGEAIRVSSKYLIITDFAPLQPYSADYHHRPGYRTYKMSYRPMVESTGFMRCLASFYHREDDEWGVVQTLLFRKIPLEQAFPVRKESDFR
jgi:SAM-dependent methyltransferase